VDALRRLGFGGSDADVLEAAYREDPVLLAAASSASGMWAANAATVSPSADTADGRGHLTPAHLVGSFHRSLEVATTARLLKAIFPVGEHFVHHSPLPSVWPMGDEGAANHTRLCRVHGERGLEFFVYGRSAFDQAGPRPAKFPARQSWEA